MEYTVEPITVTAQRKKSDGSYESFTTIEFRITYPFNNPTIPIDGALIPPPDPLTVADMREIAADYLRDEILKKGDHKSVEYLAAIILRDDGSVVVTQLYGGTDTVRSTQLAGEINFWGASKVLGILHNHPINKYPNWQENRYPSGGVLNGADWTTATNIANAGAANNGQFTMYVIDGKDEMRAFPWSMQATYANMGLSDRQSGTLLPDVIP